MLKRRSDVRFRIVDGEAVVVLQESAEVMVLNATAARLLELADGERPLAAIAAALAAEFEVEPEVLREDLLAGARELAAAGLLELAPGGGA
ncbi:MAG TPA: PqqD family protein [Thermoanaerobaculia bacterium]